MVKLLDLQAITMMHGDEYKAAANRVIESGWFYKVMKTSSLRKTMLNILVQMSV